MHRPTLGIVALLLLLAGVVGLLISNSEGPEAWPWGCLRVSLLLSAVWLAHPHLKGLHPRLVGLALLAGFAVLVFAARHPFQIALLAAVALLLGYLSIRSREPVKPSDARGKRPMRPSARG
jgi:hypothetical protein